MQKFFLIALLLVQGLFAAVGCDLNDPDRDVQRIFPQSTSYKTAYLQVDKLGGQVMYERIQKRLGDNFKGLYETSDVPYTVYTIYQGKTKIGYIHGVNQKGTYGGIQVFVALDNAGVIKNFYIQKLTSKQAAAFRSKDFAKQFVGLKLADFASYAVTSGVFPKIKNPADPADYRAILRGVKKNLILMDEFVYKGGK